MVIKVYISGISGNKEVKKRQQRVVMILESKNIEYEAIDIAEPGKEAEKEFMQQNSKAKDSKYALPPQIFNEDDYCGDYEEFDLANEMDELEKFLKLPAGSIQVTGIEKSPFANGTVTSSREQSMEKERHTRSSEFEAEAEIELIIEPPPEEKKLELQNVCVKIIFPQEEMVSLRLVLCVLSEDRISAENHIETEQDDETTECKSPVNESETKDTEGEAEKEEATDKEKSTAEDVTNNASDEEEEEEEDDEEEEEE